MLKASLELEHPRELLERWYPNGRLGGLVVHGPVPGGLGNRCELVVRFRSSDRHLTVRGRLSWARHKGSKTLKESFGIDFISEDEAGRARLLLFAQQALPETAVRHEERLATHLVAKLKTQGREWRELVADLSMGGAFVASEQPLPRGTPVELRIRPPRALRSLRLVGQVVWTRVDTSPRGMGIAFDPFDASASERLRELLARLAAPAREA
jgi:uncharacterized protein (TIGR02266 family)